ncbi:exosome component 10 isoform X2 [Bombyx mandarina]|uniref:Exosome complex component 10 homolog n=1 Tax=Bombyx mandarina TaxID=7092 RepID=A0A6J2JVE0_BOMMA|nr:exosome component 10 isoform X2 [Bombyx mandarina]
MNSALNPDAPEFYPHLAAVTQEGYRSVNKTIKSSNQLPMSSSYDLFKTYPEFNEISNQISQNVAQQSNELIGTEQPAVKLKCEDFTSNIEKLADVNDSLLDRINISIDTVSGENLPSEAFASGLNDNPSHNSSPWNKPVISEKKMGSTIFIGAKNIPRPQLTFKDTIDNSENLWVPKISDKPNNIKPLALNILYTEKGEAVGYEHPYQMELDMYNPPSQFIDPDPEPPMFPPPLEETKFTYIDIESKLDELVEHLMAVEQIAVDVEHHSYRTYQGITCLIQISTDEGGDFIIDALAVREHIHKLNVVFTDPKKLKVFHGADSDVLWLQRDFGVYLVGLFDTYHAAKSLGLPALSLKFLLMKYCGVDTDKTYRLADWRIRPLPDVLIKYARMDTHYLLYVWRVMKNQIIEKNAGQTNMLLSVFEDSRQTCASTYNKEVIHDESHIPLYIRSKKNFDNQQMAALKMLYKWRDSQARQLDESTTYLLPNHMLLSLSENLPRELQGVNACCDPMPPFVKQNVITIHRMILSCRELPKDAQIFHIPSGIRNMMNAGIEQIHYEMHDLDHEAEYREEQKSNVEQVNYCLTVTTKITSKFNPEVEAFIPASMMFPEGTIVSALNADAEMFVPPYSRYVNYRTLAQEEIAKDIKEMEAKVAAISQGNELIEEEVLQKLQKAQSHIEHDKTSVAPQAAAANDTEPDTKTAQRKRKIVTENAEEQNVGRAHKNEHVPKKIDVAKKEVTAGYQYQNATYDKFYNVTNNTKQIKGKKSKKQNVND